MLNLLFLSSALESPAELDTSDYVVGQVWGKKGANKYLLDQYRERATFTETLNAIRRMHAKWANNNFHLIEAKANGEAIIDALKRGREAAAGGLPIDDLLRPLEAEHLTCMLILLNLRL